jgi:WD40 repeat protein
MLVNIDLKLSILCVKWAPSAKKFVVIDSSNALGIGFFNTESNCWTLSTRGGDKICKSPIITLSFHPSSNIFAVGSTDNSIKIISCSFKSSKEPLVINSNI